MKHVLSYIERTTSYGIIYKGGGSTNLIEYADSDFTGYKNTRRSIKENVFMVARRPVL